jgi:hypothetical protein
MKAAAGQPISKGRVSKHLLSSLMHHNHQNQGCTPGKHDLLTTEYWKFKNSDEEKFV